MFQRWCATQEDPDGVDPSLGVTDPAATVLGAVGGGYVGHKVEERTRTHTVYQVAVRMEDGSLRHFQRAEPTAVGTPVVLQGKGFRVDQGGSARAADPYAQPQPQPGAVRVSDTY